MSFRFEITAARQVDAFCARWQYACCAQTYISTYTYIIVIATVSYLILLLLLLLSAQYNNTSQLQQLLRALQQHHKNQNIQCVCCYYVVGLAVAATFFNSFRTDLALVNVLLLYSQTECVFANSLEVGQPARRKVCCGAVAMLLFAAVHM